MLTLMSLKKMKVVGLDWLLSICDPSCLNLPSSLKMQILEVYKFYMYLLTIFPKVALLLVPLTCWKS